MCDEFWLVTGGGLKPFDGDLDDYQRWLLDQAKAAARAARPDAARAGAATEEAAAPAATSTARSAPAAKRPPRRPRAACRSAPRAPAESASRGADRKAAAAARQQRADAAKPLKKELNLVDNKLGVLFAERDALSEAASADDSLDTEKRADTGRRLKTIAVQIEALEGRWLALSTQLDDIAESVG